MTSSASSRTPCEGGRRPPKTVVAATTLLAVQMVLSVALLILTESWSDPLGCVVLGGIAVSYAASAVLLLRGRVAFPIVVLGISAAFHGWIVWEAASRGYLDKESPISVVIFSAALIGIAALLLIQTRSSTAWLAARRGVDDLSDKIKRGVWTALVCDFALLGFIVCQDFDSAIWGPPEPILIDAFCIEEDDGDYAIDRAFGLRMDVMLDVDGLAESEGAEYVDGTSFLRIRFALGADDGEFGVHGPWEVEGLVDTSNRFVYAISARHDPVESDVFSNLVASLKREVEWGPYAMQMTGERACQWADGCQAVEAVMDDDSLRVSIRRIGAPIPNKERINIHCAHWEKILHGVDFRGGTYSGTLAAVYAELLHDIKAVLGEQDIKCYFTESPLFLEQDGEKAITIDIPRGSVYEALEAFAKKVGRRPFLDPYGWREPPCVFFFEK